MTDPYQIVPRVDAGSDTFARYHYQAEVILPFCLHCALDNEITAVIPEHLEDVALETKNKWRFIQIKSKDPELGLWKLSTLLTPNGALRSLYRTFQQTRGVPTQLELILEGACGKNDPIQYLKYGNDHGEIKLVSDVSKGLVISNEEAHQFLSCVTLGKPPPPRQNIRAANILLMNYQNRMLSHAQIEPLYESLIGVIERAMRADPLGVEWPSYVAKSLTSMDASKKLEAKRLSKDYLKQIIQPLLSPPRQLLKRITDTTSDSISLLERKLMVGGATPEIINTARTLMANAQVCIYNLKAQSIFSDEAVFDDLDIRLQSYATAKKALHKSSKYPAIDTWDSLLTEFTNNPVVIDPDRVMHADPMLLLGQVCALADLCKLDWGVADAN